MDIKNLATQLLMSKLGSAGDSAGAESALSELVGKGSNFELADMVGQFTGSGGDIAAKAKSWLGDGANDSISAGQLQEVLGADKIQSFATKLGISQDDASSSLADILPQLIDKGSSSGSLLDSVGGAGGLLSSAAKLFN